MIEYNFDDIYNRLRVSIGSWAEMTRICQKVRPNITPSYWQNLKLKRKQTGKFFIPPSLAYTLEEASGGAVKKEEMCPDVFLSPKDIAALNIDVA